MTKNDGAGHDEVSEEDVARARREAMRRLRETTAKARRSRRGNAAVADDPEVRAAREEARQVLGEDREQDG